MRDVRLLRTFLDGKIPPVSGNDAEQLNILISTSKKDVGVSSDCDETTDTKSQVQTKLQFDSSDVSPIKTEVIEEDSGKIPQSSSQTFNRKNKTKKTKRRKHKKVKKARRRREYSSESSSSSSEEDTRHTREHSGGSLPYFTPFPGQPQGYHNPMPFFYQPVQPYPQTSGIQQGFQLANSDNNFVQNTNLCNTVPFRVPNVGPASSSSVTSTSSVSRLDVNDSESWSNLNTLVSLAMSCNQKSE